MSRSALNRQMQMAMATGEYISQVDPFILVDQLLEEKAEDEAVAVEFYGNRRTCNLDSIIAQNVVSHSFFKKQLAAVKTVTELTSTILSQVSHVDVWQNGGMRVPSPAICCVFRLASMRPTPKQLKHLTEYNKHVRSPQSCNDSDFVRAVALLMIRLTLPPEQLWEWLEPHCSDAGLFKAAAAARAEPTTFGLWVRSLFEARYFGVILPRLPHKLQQDYKIFLELMKMDDDRARKNERFKSSLGVGSKVRARWSEDGKMYDAEIVEVSKRGDEWRVEYSGFEGGGGEWRALGQLELLDIGDSKRHRGRSPSPAADNRRHRDYSPPRRKPSPSPDRHRRDRDENPAAGAGRRDASRSPDHRRRSPSRSHSRDYRTRNARGSRSRSPQYRRGRGSHSRSRSPYRRQSPPRRYRDEDGYDRRDYRAYDSRGAGRDRRRSPSEDHRRGGVAADDDDFEAIRERIAARDRERVVASGKDYAQRVRGFKESMSLPSMKSASGAYDRHDRERRPVASRRDSDRDDAPSTTDHTRAETAAPAPAPPSQAAVNKYNELLSRYHSTAPSSKEGAPRAGGDDVMRIRGW